MGIKLEMLFPMCPWDIALLIRRNEINLIGLKVLHYNKFVVLVH
jgi:hypothetical protein